MGLLALLGVGSNTSAVGGSLGTRVNTTIPNWEKVGIEKMSRLPRSTNKGQVLSATRMASEAEGQALLLADLAKQQQRIAKAFEKMRETRLDHNKEMMSISSNLARQDANYLKAVQRFGLNQAQAEEEVRGYDRAFNNAGSLLRF